MYIRIKVLMELLLLTGTNKRKIIVLLLVFYIKQ